MLTRRIDGTLHATTILQQTKELISINKLSPRLSIIQVGNNDASSLFVSLKQKKGIAIGIQVDIYQIPITNEEEVMRVISEHISSIKNSVDGIMIQLPLPSGFSSERILKLIPKNLDVDGLLLQSSPYPTAVAAAVWELLEKEKLKDKHITVIGSSPYVGGSVAHLLNKKGLTHYKVIDESTPNKPEHLKRADIVISCVGKPHIYNAQDLKQGAILIDVGTSKNSEGKIVGDFDTTAANGYLTAYSPVPGGVGPVTVAKLLQHTAMNALLLAR